MWPNLRLTSEETRQLEVILDSLSRRAQRRLSLHGLMKKWSRFVEQVEHGYGLSIYEYTNDLSVRCVLEDILLAVPQSLRERLAAELEAWDSRFREATLESERPLFSPASLPSHWWAFRIPRKIEGELKTDLQTG